MRSSFEQRTSPPSKIRRKNIRLSHYDYSSYGLYFVTICAAKRALLFGQIHDGGFVPNPMGEIVERAIDVISDHEEHVTVDCSVVMPNHIHMVLWIHEGNDRAHTLGNVIRGFKGYVSRECATRVWQRNYHEHIIRNEEDLQEIRTYILNNPQKWELDRHNPDNPKYAIWLEPK